MDNYYEKHYTMGLQENNDKLIVSKMSQSDWCLIKMNTNNSANGKIQIRSKAMAEQLHFMLGQLLGL